MNKLPVPSRPAALPVPVREDRDDQLAAIVSAFESETADVLLRTTPRGERSILYILLFMLLSAIVLSAVVKLDRVVTGGGTVIAPGGAIYVAPLNAGVVREVKVKVGDTVKKGQVLATLDPTLTQADVKAMQQKLDSDAASIERLTAEHDSKPYVPSKKDTFAEVQLAIWQQRQAEYHSNLANFDAQIANFQAVASQYQSDASQYQKRMALANDVQGMYEPLVKKGYVSRQQYITAKDSAEEMSRLHEEAKNQVEAQQQSAAAIRSQKAAYIQKWHGDAGAQLAATRDDYNTTKESLAKAQNLFELSTLTSPADAIVLKIGKVSAGSVAQPTVFSDPSSAGALFTLVPLEAPLEAEIDIPAMDVGFIRPGDKVTIKLEAYSFIRHGTAKGKVKTISEGSFTVDENNQPTPPYFKVRVEVTELKLKGVPKDFRLIPGMTVTGDILVGNRTILSYLAEGALRTGSEAMREAQ